MTEAVSTGQPISARDSGQAVSRLLNRASILVREDRAQTARLRLDQPGRWATLVYAAEPLLIPQQSELTVTTETVPALAKYGDRLAERWLVYGYPMCLDPRGVALGLLQVMVRLEPVGDGERFKLIRATGRVPQVNHRLLHAVGGDTAVGAMIASRLAGRDGEAWLPRALAHLAPAVGLSRQAFDPSELAYEQLQAAAAPRTRTWVNAAAIFDATPGAESADQFRLDDQARLDDATVERAFTGTGLGVLAGFHKNALPSDPTGAQDAPNPVVEVHALGGSQSDVVAQARDNPLTAAEIPPGCARLQTVVAAVATAVMAGERVLYVANQAKAADTISKAVQDLLHRDHLWLLPVPRSQNLADLRGRIVDGLRAFQNSDFEPRRKKRKGRDRPTLKYLAELHQARRGVDEQISRIQRLIDDLLAAKTKRRDLEAELPTSWAVLFDPKGKSPLPRDQFEEIKYSYQLQTGRAKPSISQRMREILKREGPQSFGQIEKALRQGLGGLSAGARETILADLNPSPDAKGLKKFINLFDKYFAWSDLRDGEKAAASAVENTGGAQRAERERFRTTNMVVSTARELVEDAWFDRISGAPRNIEQQLKALFTLFQRRVQAKDSRARNDENDDLALALKNLLEVFPLISMSAESALDLLPATPDIFDLIIVDESEAVPAGALPALAMRGRRSLVVAESDLVGRENRRSERSAFDMAAAALETAADGSASEEGVVQVQEHFRCHPDIVAYLGYCLGGGLRLRTDYARLVEGLARHHLGLVWHDMRPTADQPMRRGYDGTACIDMLKQWEADGLFDTTPRRRFGVLCPTMRSADGIAGMLDNNFRDPKRRKCITVGTPDRFVGTTVDLMIFLPGVAEDSDTSEADLAAHDPDLMVLAPAAARAGLHVIGDAQLCRDYGGFMASLVDMASQRQSGHQRSQSGDDGDDHDPLTAAFGDNARQGQARDPGALFAELLDRARLYYQPLDPDGRLGSTLPDEARDLARYDPCFRVAAAFGTAYCVMVRPSLLGAPDSTRRAAEKAADKALITAGYRIFWFEIRELTESPDTVVERLRQLI